MTSEPFEVVVIPFPFTDKPVVKRRPALILSSRAFNDRHDQRVLAMITSARHSAWPSDVRLADWKDTGLTAPCLVRFKLFTLEASLIVARVGTLAEEDRRTVEKVLRDVLTPRTAR